MREHALAAAQHRLSTLAEAPAETWREQALGVLAELEQQALEDATQGKVEPVEPEGEVKQM